jgi:WD40 repeat protein
MKAHYLVALTPLLCAAGGPIQDRPDVRPRSDFRGHREAVRHLAFAPDSKLLVSAGREDFLRLWSLESGRQVRRIVPRGRTVTERLNSTPLPRRIEAVEFSPDGSLIAEAAIETNGQTMLRLWNPEDGELLRILAERVDNMRALAFAPNGKLIASNARDPLEWGQKILLRDVETGNVVAELREKRMAASHIEFSPDGRLLASAGATKIHIWDVTQRKLLHTIPAHKKSVQSIAFSPNGKLLVSGSADDTVRVWKVDSGTMDLEIEAEQDGVLAVAFTPSGNGIASAGADKTINLWKTKSGRKYRRLWGHLDKVYCLAFSPDGKTLASGSGDSTIMLWDVLEPEDDEEEDEEDEDDEWFTEDD